MNDDALARAFALLYSSGQEIDHAHAALGRAIDAHNQVVSALHDLFGDAVVVPFRDPA